MLRVQDPVMVMPVCMPRSVDHSAIARGLLTPPQIPLKLQFSHPDVGEPTLFVPQTPYLTPQRESRDSVASHLTLCSDKKEAEREVQQILDSENEEEVVSPKRHPINPPSYSLEDLPNTKANTILYQELENRTEKVLLQPDIEDHLRRSRQRLTWAKFGGGETCSQRLIEDLSSRIRFLEECLLARKALTEGEYTAEVLKLNHDDLVWLEKSIGGFWARPRRVGREWRFLPQGVIGKLAGELETLDGLEEFVVVNDLLHAIVSSTGLCNLLVFGAGVSRGRRGYWEDRLMGEYTWYDRDGLDEDDGLYDANGRSVLIDGAVARTWIYEPETMESRMGIVNDFMTASLPNLAKEGKMSVERNSWADGIFQVDLDEEPRPLSFKEKDHLAQRAIALKDHLRYLLGNNAVLRRADTDVRTYATLGPSGVGVGFRAVGRSGDGFVFPTPLDAGGEKEGRNGSQYSEEVNHRGEEFDGLREEFRHAIQCWRYLLRKHGKDISEYLVGRQGAKGGCEKEDAGELGSEMIDVEEPMFDGTTLDEEVTLHDDSEVESEGFTGPSSVHHQSASETQGSREVEAFSSGEETFLNSSPPSSFTEYQDPIAKPSPQKHQIEQAIAPTPKRPETSYLRKYDIHPTHLDGASRVCPETGETWWADCPPYFLFGETPTMAKVISDQIIEDLRKGQEDLADGPNFFPGGGLVDVVQSEIHTSLPLEGENEAVENASPAFMTTAQHDGTTYEPMDIDEEPVDDDVASDDDTICESSSSPSEGEDMGTAGQESDSEEENMAYDVESESDSSDESSEDDSESETEQRVDSFIGSDRPHLAAKGDFQLSKTQRRKSRPVTTPARIAIPTKGSHLSNSNYSSPSMSTPSLRKTPWGAISTVRRLSRLSTMTLAPSAPYVCDECGKGFYSLEVATFHAEETGHFPKHCDAEEHKCVARELIDRYEADVDNRCDGYLDGEDFREGDLSEDEDGDEYQDDDTGEEGPDSEEDSIGSEEEEMSSDDEMLEEDEETSTDEEEPEECRHKAIVDATPHKAVLSKQSAPVHGTHYMPTGRPPIQKVPSTVYTPNNPVVSKKTTTVATTTTSTMTPRNASYKMAREIAPNDFQCGATGCEYHNNPRSLATHVMAHHSGSIKDWTREAGFKCEWKGCPDRHRMADGVYRHCVDVHLPPVPNLSLSKSTPRALLGPRVSAPRVSKAGRVFAVPRVSSVSRVTPAPRISTVTRIPSAPRIPTRPQVPEKVQHSSTHEERVEKIKDVSRPYRAKYATRNHPIASKPQQKVPSMDESNPTNDDTDEEANQQLHHEATASAASSLPDYEEYASAEEEQNEPVVVVDVAHEQVVLKRHDPALDSDSDSEFASDSDVDGSVTLGIVGTPRTAPRVRGGLLSYFSPLRFWSATGGGKRKRGDGGVKEVEETETPVRGRKRVRFEGSGKRDLGEEVVVRSSEKRGTVKEKGKVQEMEMVRNYF